jgi:serine/threonine protein kinase
MGLTKDDVLGEGSFSICRKGTDLATGEAVAIKIYKVQQGEEVNCQAVRAKFARQVAVLQHLQDDSDQLSSVQCGVPPKKCRRFFVRLLDFSVDANGSPGPDSCDGVMCVVTELAEYSLKDYFRKQQKLGQLPPSKVVRELSRAVVLATAALHSKGYVHLDLKPENMMFFNGRLKIIDVDGCVKIGTTLSLQDSSSSFSPCYCAPELARLLLAGGRPEIVATPSLDAWSVGLILCECVTLGAVLRPAFVHFRKSTSSSMEAYVAFMDWLGRLETPPVPDCVGQFDAGLGEVLFHGLLACDPQMRLTPTQCLSRPYLAAA